MRQAPGENLAGIPAFAGMIGCGGTCVVLVRRQPILSLLENLSDEEWRSGKTPQIALSSVLTAYEVMPFYVYMMTNKPHGVLYIGMTDDINRRAWEHREHVIKGFTHRYNCEMLVWLEAHETRKSAFDRERRLKKWERAWKIRLIEEMNPDWRDLADGIL